MLSAPSADRSSAMRGFLSKAVDADYTVRPGSEVERYHPYTCVCGVCDIKVRLTLLFSSSWHNGRPHSRKLYANTAILAHINVPRWNVVGLESRE